MPPRIVDADQHIVEPPDMWTSRMSKKYTDVVPHVVDFPEGGHAWNFGGGEWVRPVGLLSGAGRSPKDFNWHQSYDDMFASCYDPKERVRDMDIDGVDAAVLFPSIAMALSGCQDDGFYLDCFRTYNDAMWDWCQEGDPTRLYPAAIMPTLGTEIAMAELERVSRMGYKGFMFNSWPSGGPHPSDADDPFWALCQETDTVVCLHGPGAGRAKNEVADAMAGARKDSNVIRRTPQERVTDSRATALGVVPAVADFVFSGILERFPRLKLAMTETGAGWQLFFMEQLDRTYTHQRWAWSSDLQLLPSEYLKRQTKATIQLDAFAVRYRHLLGVDNMMWATDFPHVTADWPNSRELIHLLFRDVAEDERDRILSGNATDFYGMS